MDRGCLRLFCCCAYCNRDESGLKMMEGWFSKIGRTETPPTVRASFVQEVAEVEQSVSRCQELKESLQERTHTQGLVLC